MTKTAHHTHKHPIQNVLAQCRSNMLPKRKTNMLGQRRVDEQTYVGPTYSVLLAKRNHAIWDIHTSQHFVVR